MCLWVWLLTLGISIRQTVIFEEEEEEEEEEEREEEMYLNKLHI